MIKKNLFWVTIEGRGRGTFVEDVGIEFFLEIIDAPD